MTTTCRKDRRLARSRFLRHLAATALVIAGAVAAACSTTEGFGKDVKDLGGGIEKSAADNK